MKKTWPFLALAVLALVAGCTSQPQESGSSQKLVFGIIDYPGLAPAYLAQARGLFEKHGIEVELVPVQDFASMNAGVSTGRFDLVAMTADAFAIAAAQGVRGKIVFSSSQSRGADGVLVRKEVASLHGLAGKRVALEKGTPSHYLLLVALQREGIPANRVEVVDTAPADAALAFSSGQVEAAVTFEPWLTTAMEKGNGKVLVDSDGVPVIHDVFIASEQALSSKRTALARFMRAWFEAVAYARASPQEANAVMGRAYGMDAATFAGFMEKIALYDLATARQQTAALPSFLEQAQAIWRREGFIEEARPGSDLVEQAILQQL